MRLRRRCSCDRQRVPRRRARVGGLCGFPSAAEQRTRLAPENRTLRRCAGALRERQAQKEIACRRLAAEGEAAIGEARQEKRLGAFLRQPVHVCPQCGQFWAIKTALFCEG